MGLAEDAAIPLRQLDAAIATPLENAFKSVVVPNSNADASPFSDTTISFYDGDRAADGVIEASPCR